MSEKLKLFSKILKAELEDLVEDMESWTKYLEQRHREQKITEYVYMENTGVLKQELASVRTLIDKVSGDTPATQGSLENLRDHFLELFTKAVKDNLFPEAVLSFVSRKVEKVYDYLKV